MRRCSVLVVGLAIAAAAAAQTSPRHPASRPATAQSPSRPAAVPTRPAALTPGNHLVALAVDGNARSYWVHVPRRGDANTPWPVVLVLHGAMMDGSGMAAFSGMNDKSDAAGFLAVYPDGSGSGALRFWNAGADRSRPHDVKFIAALLDDLASLTKVDAAAVYATGMSNGGMMCYLLASELSDRIAAIAPVAGTMCIDKPSPKRPVPVMHFHGMADKIVPYAGPDGSAPKWVKFQSVESTISAWVKLNGCHAEPAITEIPDKAKDGTSVRMKLHGGGKNDAEVVLVAIEGGGHTWPGQRPIVGFIGKSTSNISANDMIWEFFQKHRMK